jgi:hypothetical protein
MNTLRSAAILSTISLLSIGSLTGILLSCQETLPTEQQMTEQVARFACYAASAHDAEVSLHELCPDAKTRAQCPALGPLFTELQKKLEACDVVK